MVISPHGIAMSKGLYLTAVVFSFFRRLIFEVTERISTKLGHIHLWLLREKFGPNFPGHLPSRPTGWGQKTLFGTDFELWRKISLQRNMKSTIGKKLVRDSPICPIYLVSFGSETAENRRRVFAHSPKFSHWETLPALSHGRYITDSGQTLARIM